jgi:protein gp37
MAQSSSIEWTEATWNPVTGCSKISAGCKNCYAERMAHRLMAMGAPGYEKGFEVSLQERVLRAPLSWRKGRMIFVNSMSDLFHEDVPFEYIARVIEVIRQAHWHQFQILTKRPDRLLDLDPMIEWPGNAWVGVSIENDDFTWRAARLRKTNVAIRFLSLEPLLGPLPSLDLAGIDWVIVGGESGPHARTIDPEWVLDIRDRCLESGVPFFFKQWGGTRKKKTGRRLEGSLWNQMPRASVSLHP